MFRDLENEENTIKESDEKIAENCQNDEFAQDEVVANESEPGENDDEDDLENEGEIDFEDLGLDEKTLEAVEKKGFKIPSPIQVLAIPRLLHGDANMIARARTGTGKTAAFGLPLVQRITEKMDFPQALILTPTRELCLQVCTEIESFTNGKFPRMVACYGGQGMAEQIRTLKKGVEIVVGTPGRVQDHMERGLLDLSKISYFILDEADEMLDMGFIDDIKAIFAKANPDSRILLFSATMPKEILQIASDFMGDYEIIEEEKKPEEPLLTEQFYWIVRENEKIEALVRLIDISPDFYGLVFTQTKIDADNVSRALEERGYEANALHGDIAQSQREKILWRFRNRKTRILVATDVAARGIDIEGLTHVVNYALPFDAPTYIHRIGRTGRAGKTGFAFTFVRPEERRKLEFIKKAQFKSTKGELKEGEIPSIEKVLETKREQLFEQMREKLTADTDSTLEAETPFSQMARILCEQKDPLEVLSQVLSLSYGKSLDASRYGEITPLKVFNQGNQIRIYVQLGRVDGYNPKKIAEFFSRLCRISQRLVDRIDMSDKFTLVSLPAKEGKEILERSQHDKSLPHMHLDAKESEGNYSRKFSGERRGGRGGHGGHGGRSRSRERDRANGGFEHSRRRGFEGKGKSGFSGKREGGKKPLHSSRTSNASLYKK